MSQKTEKPVLSGQRIKTRKRGKFWSLFFNYFIIDNLIIETKHYLNFIITILF